MGKCPLYLVSVPCKLGKGNKLCLVKTNKNCIHVYKSEIHGNPTCWYTEQTSLIRYSRLDCLLTVCLFVCLLYLVWCVQTETLFHQPSYHC